jgi:hypothetical protein
VREIIVDHNTSQFSSIYTNCQKILTVYTKYKKKHTHTRVYCISRISVYAKSRINYLEVVFFSVVVVSCFSLTCFNIERRRHRLHRAIIMVGYWSSRARVSHTHTSQPIQSLMNRWTREGRRREEKKTTIFFLR